MCRGCTVNTVYSPGVHGRASIGGGHRRRAAGRPSAPRPRGRPSRLSLLPEGQFGLANKEEVMAGARFWGRHSAVVRSGVQRVEGCGLDACVFRSDGQSPGGGWPRHRRPRCRFTLIELLVVIGIIALLVSILLPALAGARQKARAARCAGNLKQVGIALYMYVDDYEESFPPNHWGFGTPTWADHMNEYLNSENVLNCPSSDVVWTPGSEFTFSYILNNVYGGSADLQLFERNHGMTRLSALEDSAQTIFCGDGREKFQAYGTSVTRTTVDGVYQWQSSAGQGWFSARHSGGYNFVMADGHVEWFPKLAIDEKSSAGNYRYFTRILD